MTLKKIHLTMPPNAITKFLDIDRSNMICYRCGEVGHVRFQCLTYKVKLCARFESGQCNDKQCQFAHGAAELRMPWKQRCVRVIRHNGGMICIGCNSDTHTFRRCPLYQDMIIF